MSRCNLEATIKTEASIEAIHLAAQARPKKLKHFVEATPEIEIRGKYFTFVSKVQFSHSDKIFGRIVDQGAYRLVYLNGAWAVAPAVAVVAGLALLVFRLERSTWLSLVMELGIVAFIALGLLWSKYASFKEFAEKIAALTGGEFVGHETGDEIAKS